MRIYVLDSSAILSFFMAEGELYSPPEVWEEVLRHKDKLGEIYFVYYTEFLRLREPKKEFLEKVIEAAKETGDIFRLSETDIKVIALGKELKAIVVTNDTSIQNMCEVLGIKYMEFGGKRIRKVFKWRLRCTSCGRYFDEYYEKCPYCGGKLKTVRDKNEPKNY